MPDKPTDKKLTLIEFAAKGEGISVKLSRKIMEKYANTLIGNGIHKKGCGVGKVTCKLCTLEYILSEYYKYFKEK